MLTRSQPVAGTRHFPVQSQENRTSPKLLPAGTFCGSQQRRANKIRCDLLFSSYGHIPSVSLWSDIRPVCVQTQGHGPRLGAPVTTTVLRDERGALAQPSPYQAPNACGSRPGTMHCIPGLGAEVDLASLAPHLLPPLSPEGWWTGGSRNGHWLHSCGGSFGEAGGKSQPDVTEEQLGTLSTPPGPIQLVKAQP